MSRIVAMGFGASVRRMWTRRPPVRGPLCQRAPEDRRSVVLCTLLRADEAAHDRVLARARRWPRVRVVALTDGEAAGPLLSRGIAVEHLPSPGMVARHAALDAWRPYLEGRWAMIRARWEPAMVIDEGVAFAAWLQLCGAALAAARQPWEDGHATVATS